MKKKTQHLYAPPNNDVKESCESLLSKALQNKVEEIAKENDLPVDFVRQELSKHMENQNIKNIGKDCVWLDVQF